METETIKKVHIINEQITFELLTETTINKKSLWSNKTTTKIKNTTKKIQYFNYLDFLSLLDEKFSKQNPNIKHIEKISYFEPKTGTQYDIPEIFYCQKHENLSSIKFRKAIQRKINKLETKKNKKPVKYTKETAFTIETTLRILLKTTTKQTKTRKNEKILIQQEVLKEQEKYYNNAKQQVINFTEKIKSRTQTKILFEQLAKTQTIHDTNKKENLQKKIIKELQNLYNDEKEKEEFNNNVEQEQKNVEQKFIKNHVDDLEDNNTIDTIESTLQTIKFNKT